MSDKCIYSCFEETVQDGARVIDIVASVKPFRRELKSWRSFAENYKSRFIKEFAEDLKGIDNLDDMGWYFDAKDTLADKANLKQAVLETLSSAEGREALDNSIIRKLFEDFGKKTDPTLLIEDTDDLIQYINDKSEWFDLIFK